MRKIKSPYTAAITGGGFLFDETNALLPLLEAENSEELLKDENINNRVLHINAETSRKRATGEIKRRFECMPRSFWTDYKLMNVEEQIIALFLVILKTYKILFDFHVNVTLKKWNSISKSVQIEDLMLEFNEIAANDEFVDSWSDATKKKIAGSYLTILRRIKMLGEDGKLSSVNCSNITYYLTHNEAWFLEACLLQPYEIDNIKKSLL